MSHCFVKTQDGEALSLCSVKTKIRRNYVALSHMVQTSIILKQPSIKRYVRK